MIKGWYITGGEIEDTPKETRERLLWLESRVGSDTPPYISWYQEEIPEYHRGYVTAWWNGNRFTRIRYRDNDGNLFIKPVRKVQAKKEAV